MSEFEDFDKCMKVIEDELGKSNSRQVIVLSDMLTSVLNQYRERFTIEIAVSQIDALIECANMFKDELKRGE